MKFFFDRNISHRIAGMLDIYEDGLHKILHLDRDPRFIETTDDRTWIRVLGMDDPNWVILTCDWAILSDARERAILMASKLKTFFLTNRWNKMDFPEHAWRFVKVWPDIKRTVQRDSGQLFEIAAGTTLRIRRLS